MKKNMKPGCLIFIISIILAVVSIKAIDVFRNPFVGTNTISKVNEIDDTMYPLLEEVDQDRADLYAAIEEEEMQIKQREQEAQALYDSIPEGAVIKKGLGSPDMPVGTYKKVVEMRKKVTRDYARLERKKRKIVVARGPVVHNEGIKKLWQEHIQAQEKVTAYFKEKQDYDQSGEGKRRNFFHTFFCILSALSIIVAMLMFFVSLEDMGM